MKANPRAGIKSRAQRRLEKLSVEQSPETILGAQQHLESLNLRMNLFGCVLLNAVVLFAHMFHPFKSATSPGSLARLYW